MTCGRPIAELTPYLFSETHDVLAEDATHFGLAEAVL
jgi:hypothetical protein